MKWFLLWALSTTGAIIVMVCVAVLFVRHRVQRHHRVDQRVPTPAPVTWLVDPRSPARLHRRLARVGRTALAVGEDHRPRTRKARKAEPSPLLAAAHEIRDRAVALDRQLARVAVLAPAARREPLEALSRAVTDLEAAAVRLVELSTEVRTPRTLAHDDVDVTDLRGQLDRLAEAHRELDRLDADAGLAPAAGPPPPPPPVSAPARVVRAAVGRTPQP